MGLVYIGFLIARSAPEFKSSSLIFSLGIAAAFFFIIMEEISWLPQVLEIETPEIFSGNIQDEINLHNFATNKVENADYFSAFIVLILSAFNYAELITKLENKLFG